MEEVGCGKERLGVLFQEFRFRMAPGGMKDRKLGGKNRKLDTSHGWGKGNTGELKSSGKSQKREGELL
mgnify:CR=1 FL=1